MKLGFGLGVSRAGGTRAFGWAPTGATLAVDFLADRASDNSAFVPLSDLAVVSRSTHSLVFSEQRTPQNIDPNTLRVDHDPETGARRGVRRDPSIVYDPINGRFSGASPGVWPEGWAETPNNTDVVCEVEGVVDDELILTFDGPSDHGTGRAIYFNAAGDLAAAFGDVKHLAMTVRMLPDEAHPDTDMTGFASFNLDLAAYDAGPVKLADNAKPIDLSVDPQDFSFRLMMPNAGTASVRPGIQCFIPDGNTVHKRIGIRAVRQASTLFVPPPFDVGDVEVETPATFNKTFDGATGTTLPSDGWALIAANGITYTWTVQESGRTWLRISGTSSSATPKQIRWSALNGISAAAGEAWRGKARIRLVSAAEAGHASSMTGFTSFDLAVSGSNGSALVDNVTGTNLVSSLTDEFAPVETDNTLAGTLSYVLGIFRSVIPNGTAVDATLEIEALDLVEVETSYIDTASADAISVADGAWRDADAGTILVEFEPEDLADPAVVANVIGLDYGGGDVIELTRSPSGFYGGEVVATTSQGDVGLGSRQTTRYVRAALAYDDQGFIAQVSDNAHQAVTGGISLPSGTPTLRIGTGGFSGWIRRFAYLPRKMSAAEINRWCGGDVVTEGVISDRCRGANGRIGGGSYTRAESRILIDFPEGTTSAAILLPTYYVPTTQGAETYDDLSSYTARAYLEYEGETVEVGGPVVVTPGALEARMPLTLPETIPAGAYYLRIGAEFAAGGYVPGVYDVGDSGEGFYLSPAASQLSGTGAMSTPSGGASTTAGFGPVGIVGLDETGAIPDSAANISDSIGFGQTATATGQPLGWFPQGANAAGIPSMNLGRGGTRALETDPAVAPIRMNLVKYGTITTVALGTNDLQLLDETVPAIIDHIINIGVAVRKAGSKPIFVPVMPRCGASTDGWATAANQDANPGFETGGNRRDPLNSALDSLVGVVFAAKLDLNAIAADATFVDKWRSNGVANTGLNTDYSTNDGIHPHKVLHTACAAEFESEIPTLLAA